MIQPCSINELTAFRIGHAHDGEAATGCTAVIAPDGAVCGVDVRGGGPATRETDLLKPENMIEAVHAVVLSGGSAFGLEASCGVMEALAERKIGFELGGAYVPIVVGACLFDLLVGKPIHPDKAMGRAAAEAALSECNETASGAESREIVGALAQGNVGAGCGATVGKLGLPQAAMKSGLGWSCLSMGELKVGALVAVNAIGCVCDEAGQWIAGVQNGQGGVMNPLDAMAQAAAAMAGNANSSEADPEGARREDPSQTPPCTNTTIGVIITNAKLTKSQATKVASISHDAYARAIKPVHTSNDGDAIFAFASGEVPASMDIVAVLGTEAMQQAILNAVRSAEGAYGLPAARDLKK